MKKFLCNAARIGTLYALIMAITNDLSHMVSVTLACVTVITWTITWAIAK